MSFSNTKTSETGVSTPDVSSEPDNRPVIAVFCGASPGTSPAHKTAAESLGKLFASQNIKLVYGGGTGGIMGVIGSTVARLSGKDAVHGVIPTALMAFEQEHRSGGELSLDTGDYGRITEVKSMHERKALMAKEVMEGGPGSGFVALSGGWGTLEEIMEMATWNQLSIHDRGLVLYNVEGYWTGLIHWVETAVGAGFISAENREILTVAESPEEVVRKLRDYKLSPKRMKLDWAQK